MTLLQLRNDLRFTAQPGPNGWRCTLEDIRHQRFYRMGRREYLIASSLNGTRPIKDAVAWVAKQLQTENPDSRIEDATLLPVVDSTIRWLVSVGLVVPVGVANQPLNSQDSRTAANEAMEQSAEEKLFKPVGDPFGFRIPCLLGRTLEAWIRPFTWLFSWPVAIFAIALLFVTMVRVAGAPDAWAKATVALFVPEAAGWWFAAWLLLKSVHELGHAIACIAFGGRLRTAGIAVFYFAPIPYVDTTDMWRLPNRLARMTCALAGMLAELVVACLALQIAYSTDSTSLQYFCFSLATLGTFTTIAFNGNPLSRFDGYFVLSDLLDRPNLWAEGQTAMLRWFRLGFEKGSKVPPPASIPLASYGFACFLYRGLILSGLAWGAWIAWQGIGLILIALGAAWWLIIPWWKRLLRAAAQPSPNRMHWSVKRSATTSLALLLFLGLCSLFPSPYQPLSPAYISFKNAESIVAPSDGIIAHLGREDGAFVQAGDLLFTLHNPHLETALKTAEMELGISQERVRILRADSKMSEYQLEIANGKACAAKVEQLRREVAGLQILADRSGLFFTSVRRQAGAFVKAGTLLGQIADSRDLEAVASVEQTDAQVVRHQSDIPVTLYLDSGRHLSGRTHGNLSRGSDIIENIALAAKYGGPIPVQLQAHAQDGNQLVAPSPRFEVRIQIAPQDADRLNVGQLCRVRLSNHPTSFWDAAGRWLKALQDLLINRRTPNSVE